MKVRNLSDFFNKFIFVILILVFSSSSIFSKKIGNLDDILKPFMLKSGKNRIFVSDQHSVSSYSIDKVKFLKKIGGRGEGPGEFMEEPFIKVLNERLLLHCLGRSIFFSLNCKLLKQLKNNGEFYDINCVQDNYIVYQMKIPQNKERDYFFNLIVKDSSFNEIKIIGSVKSPMQQSLQKKKKFIVEPVFKFQSFDGKIYIVSDQEGKFIIDIYCHNGILLRQIKREYNLIRISDKYKKRKLVELKSHPEVKKNWTIISRRMDFCFPEYFPAMEDFRVRDGKIYVKTYKPGKEGVEFLVLDLQGKLLYSSFLPDIKIELWDIRNNHFYYLNSDEDLEMWELHSIKIQ